MPRDSLWLKYETKQYPSLKQDIKCDAVIIGGGLCGLQTAYLLKNAGLRVVVLEAGRIGGGISGRTTAKITAQHDVIYESIYKLWGKGVAEAYGKANTQAIDQIIQTINDLGADCELERKDAYVYTSKEESIKKLEKEAEISTKIGIEQTVQQDSLLPFKTKATLRMPNQACFHPIKYIDALAEYVDGDGSAVYEYSRVVDIFKNGVGTADAKVYADKIIVATGYPIMNAPGFYFLRLYQHRAVVLSASGAKLEGMHISLEKNGISLRMQKDLLIMAGSDYSCGYEGKIKHRQLLIDTMKNYYPEGELVDIWSNQDCMPPDYLPYIGRYSKKTPNIFVATGFKKWGITQSMVSAQIISGLITGNKKGYEDVFSPQRRKLPEAPGYIKLIGHTLKAYAVSIGRLGNPACSHMGGRLTWNQEEQSWDCPAHGSRFTKDGTILIGPANEPLKLRKKRAKND